jgi:hypothetical protein
MDDIDWRAAQRHHLHLCVAALRVRPGARHVQTDPGTVSKNQGVVCVWGFSGDTEKAKARFERTQPDRLCISLAEALEHVQELVQPKSETAPLAALTPA